MQGEKFLLLNMLLTGLWLLFCSSRIKLTYQFFLGIELYYNLQCRLSAQYVMALSSVLR